VLFSSKRRSVIDLSSVRDFGAIDADADELLSSCFQDHEAFQRARSNQSFLVLGRKGSGKTAIYQRLLSLGDARTFSDGHSFDDYPWHHHDLQAEIGVPPERRYAHSWRFLILMAISKILLNKDTTQPWSASAKDSLHAIRDFVVDSYGSPNPDVGSLFLPDRELHLKASLKLPIGGVQAERIRLRDLPRHVQEVNRAILEHVLAALNPHCQYYVCFDQLDLGFTLTQPEYALRLNGLILAARELFLAARRAQKKLNVVVFLRDDIYLDLQFEDKNKITENFATRVVWTEQGDSLTLASLMERRFSAVISGNRGPVRWDDVFDSTQPMPGKQSKYKHICDRTFLRPRDMIKFCNEILRVHRNRRLPAGTRFDNVSVEQARRDYSDYLLNELDDEIAKHVPAYKSYLDVLKAVGTERFELQEFVSTWQRRVGGGPVRAHGALERLFEFSVVGYIKPSGRGGGSEYAWRYRDSRARFEIDAPRFRVHPGFREVLGLRG
jgi:hypothetical protein